MNGAWRFFIVIECLLGLGILLQFTNNIGLLILFAIGVFFLFFAAKGARGKNFHHFWLFLGLILMLIALFNSWAFWLMLVFAIIFLGLKGVEISGVQLFNKAPWKEKSMVMVDTVPPEKKGGRRFKRPWFNNDRIGTDEVYEWDDINLNVVSGDTIIDLGNTLLPKNDNVILLRKGFGRTRILVPTGIGVMVEHSCLYGHLGFDSEEYQMKNETIRLFSNDYDQNERRLKIITSSLVGDLEVIRV